MSYGIVLKYKVWGFLFFYIYIWGGCFKNCNGIWNCNGRLKNSKMSVKKVGENFFIL